MTRRTLFTVMLALLALGAVAAGTVIYYGARTTGSVTTSGKALVGGPFELTRHDGKRVSDKDFRGKYMLVYFGYTFCPDVCPSELQVISAAIDRLGKDADKITPVFITIDPERDTVEVMAQYVANFSPRLVGLTGSPEDIAKVAKAYRVYYARAKDSGEASEYLMDHTSIIYLMGPNGEFVRHFPYTTDVDAVVKGLRAALAKG